VKKIMILALIVAFMVSMLFIGTSCKEEAVTTETTAAETTAAETTAAETTVAQEKVTLTFRMHVGDVESQEPSVWGAVEEFMKQNPNIIIDLSGTPGGMVTDHLRTLKMAATSGTLPDIFWMLNGVAREMAQAGYTLDLSEFIENNKDITDEFLPGMIENMMLDNGFVIGLPYTGFISGFFVNRSLFDKYGVQIPETYEDLKEVVTIFKQNDVVTIAQGSKDSFSTWVFQLMLCRYGFFEKLDSILAGVEKYNNPDFLRCYQKIDELSKLGAFPENGTTMGYMDMVAMFKNGESAMLNGAHALAKDFETLDFAKDIDFWWGPTFNDGVGNQQLTTFVPGPPLVISVDVKKDQAKYDAVVKFLRFYYSNEGQEIMIANEFPTVVAYDINKIDKEKTPVLYKLYEAAYKPGWVPAKNQPDLAIPDIFVSAMNDSIHGVINGIYTPEEALNVVDEQLKEIIE